ncbi:restriction endonuclease [Halobellus rarus]|uniref:Restriction endonuclease n=1 Tax=Halobellus rarus TaxID=1126237 RepID=A0ABD6CGZ9_9EURY
MIPELEPDEFVSFLADLWEARGWETSVRERADETHFVIGKRGDGKRGIIYVFPTATATVTERHLKQFVGFCRKRGVDVAVVATQGAFAEGARRIAGQRSVHLLNRSALANTVEEGGFEDVLGAYTETSGIDAVVERLEELGVPVPAALVERVAAVGAALGSIRERFDRGDGGDDGVSDAAGGTDTTDSSSDDGPTDSGSSRLGALRSRLGGLSARSVPAVVIPLVLVVAFVLGATMGPAVGLGSPLALGGNGGTDVSAVSTAGANATVDVRWNAKTTGSLTVNGTTYDAPDEQQFLLVRMNVTNREAEPTQFGQSALAVDVAGDRYAHQPLDGVTGFPSAGLFAPEETREVWTVFAIPENGTSATLLTTDETGVRFVHDTSLTPEATVESENE